MVEDSSSTYSSSILTEQLLLSVIEQLKLPLMNIARRAELATIEAEREALSTIRIAADTTLGLLDSYLLGVQLANRQSSQAVELQPVSVSSVLYDVSHQLEPFAKLYGVQLDLQIDGNYGPVMAHRRGLQAALLSLGYVLIEALPAQDTEQLTLELSAHRCRYGIVAGLYCETGQITAHTLRLGKQLYGRARQPLGSFSHSSGAGVFVADAILQSMRRRLTTSRHRHRYGLGTVLPLNPQLQLI